MPRLWFKAKQYGYGWYPSSWEGWLTLLVYLGLLLGGAALLSEQKPPAPTARIIFVIFVLLITGVLFAICLKTGEKPRWRWGK